MIIQKETPGIGLNRLQFAVMREAFHMVDQGIVSPEDLDRIIDSPGQARGPYCFGR